MFYFGSSNFCFQKNFLVTKKYFSNFHFQKMELRVGNKYRLGRKIGSGSFGDIYLGKCATATKWGKLEDFGLPKSGFQKKILPDLNHQDELNSWSIFMLIIYL